MTSPFLWRGTPSAIAQSLKPHPMARDLSPKRLHVYAEATCSDATREGEIVQINREVERHFRLAQEADTPSLQAVHRDEARRLAARVKALVASRPDSYVAYLEQNRGLV